MTLIKRKSNILNLIHRSETSLKVAATSVHGHGSARAAINDVNCYYILFIVPEWLLTPSGPRHFLSRIHLCAAVTETGNRNLPHRDRQERGELPTSAPYSFLIGAICHCKVYKARSFTTQKKIAPQHLSSVSGRVARLQRQRGEI